MPGQHRHKLLCCILFLSGFGTAQATIIRYTLDNVTFDDGGTVEGYIDWDTSLPDLRDFNGNSQNYELTVSNGDTDKFPEYTYSFSAPADIDTGGQTGALRIIRFNSNNTTPNRALFLIPNSNLATLGQSLDVPLFFSPGNSFEMEFQAFNTRDVITGTLKGEVIFLDSDNDGIADDQDPFPNAVTELNDDGVTVTTLLPESSSTCSLQSIQTLLYGAGKPDDFQDTLGFTAQTALEGCSASEEIDVMLTFEAAIPRRAKIYQVVMEEWSEVPDAEIAGNTVSVKLKDNDTLDTDSTIGAMALSLTYVIPPPLPPQPVPSLMSKWLLLLGSIVLFVGIHRLNLQRAA